MTISKAKKVFVGHDFYAGFRQRRIKKYRAIFTRNFKGSPFCLIFQRPQIRAVADGHMIKDILKNIKQAHFCIFDLTGYRPKRFSHNLNAIIELGMGIGAGKMCYAIWKKGSINLTHISDLQQAIPWRYEYKDNRDLGEIIREIVISNSALMRRRIR